MNDKTIADLEKGLLIDEHALERALMEQPSIFYKVSSLLAIAISRRDGAKQDKEVIEAKADAKIRHDAEVGGEKITEKLIEGRKILRVMDLSNELLELNGNVGQLSALKEAFQQRSYVLNKLTDLYIAGYYGDANHTSGSRRMNEHLAEAVKRDNAKHPSLSGIKKERV